jgi:DNA-damage-inducible protein D
LHEVSKIERIIKMSNLNAKEYKCFEDIKHIRSDGGEYWSARELAPVLGYAKWENFSKVIDKAMIACKNSGHEVSDHFPDVRKMVDIGSGAGRSVDDYELTRYACYLIVQNGDPRKEVIALGQTYFAIQTYRQEIADRFNQLDEDSRRLVIRGDIKQWNQLLAEAARDAGVITEKEFAVFQNAGYAGLYGGLTVEDIHERKGLDVRDKILDFMGSTELIANLFRISQTEEKLKRENTHGVKAAKETHYKVGAEVRETIKRVGGEMPEDMPTPEKSIAQIQKEQLARIKRKAEQGQLMLDE